MEIEVLINYLKVIEWNPNDAYDFGQKWIQLTKYMC